MTKRLSTQTLHIGSLDDEVTIVAQTQQESISSNGLEMQGTHHVGICSIPLPWWLFGKVNRVGDFVLFQVVEKWLSWSQLITDRTWVEVPVGSINLT